MAHPTRVRFTNKTDRYIKIHDPANHYLDIPLVPAGTGTHPDDETFEVSGQNRGFDIVADIIVDPQRDPVTNPFDSSKEDIKIAWFGFDNPTIGLPFAQSDASWYGDQDQTQGPARGAITNPSGHYYVDYSHILRINNKHGQENTAKIVGPHTDRSHYAPKGSEFITWGAKPSDAKPGKTDWVLGFDHTDTRGSLPNHAADFYGFNEAPIFWTKYEDRGFEKYWEVVINIALAETV